MPQLGVIIVNYNGRAYIGDCLRSLRASTFAQWLVVVVDNRSTDGSADCIASEFPEVVLVRNPVNAGFTGGVNAGIRVCLDRGAEAVVLLNPDTIIEAGALAAFADAMRRHPHAVLTPAICYVDRPTIGDSYAGRINWWQGRIQPFFLHRDLKDLPARDARVDTASGCCLLIPTSVINEVGLLDDAYFLYYEDADYLARASSCGVELWYIPAARVLHREGCATGGPTSPLAMYYYVRNRHYFVRKFRRGRPVYVLFVVYSVIDAIRRAGWMLLNRQPALAAAVVRGTLDGWAGQTGRSAAY